MLLWLLEYFAQIEKQAVRTTDANGVIDAQVRPRDFVHADAYAHPTRRGNALKLLRKGLRDRLRVGKNDAPY